jgi:hypothetical protein
LSSSCVFSAFYGKRAGGAVEWLGEVERPVFGGTEQLEFYSSTMNALLEKIDAAVKESTDTGNCEKARRAVATRLRRALEETGFRRNPHERRKKR